MNLEQRLSIIGELHAHVPLPMRLMLDHHTPALVDMSGGVFFQVVS